MVEAFRDHWGFNEENEQTVEQWVENPNFDPSLWRVAWEGDQVAGMVLSYIDDRENQAYNRKRGWTEDISVRRPWRRRGLARALLVQSLHAVRRARHARSGAGGGYAEPDGSFEPVRERRLPGGKTLDNLPETYAMIRGRLIENELVVQVTSWCLRRRSRRRTTRPTLFLTINRKSNTEPLLTIRAVIFDFGGVLLRTEDPYPRQQLAARLGLPKEKLYYQIFDSESARLATIGKVSAEAHWEAVRQALGIGETEFQEARAAFWAGDRLDEGADRNPAQLAAAL